MDVESGSLGNIACEMFDILIYPHVHSTTHTHIQTHTPTKTPLSFPLGSVYASVNLLVSVAPLWDQQLIGYLQMSVMLLGP